MVKNFTAECNGGIGDVTAIAKFLQAAVFCSGGARCARPCQITTGKSILRLISLRDSPARRGSYSRPLHLGPEHPRWAFSRSVEEER